MKIAIHHKKSGFSERWINYCNKNNIDYKIVDCYNSNIIKQLNDCDALMWHHHHIDYKDILFAKQLLYSVKQSGKKVFPDYYTNWHFDDKIGQKYLLEAIRAPVVPTYVFYSKQEAISWAKNTKYPKVFKLRGGAGSQNVQLVYSYSKAKKIINQAFGRGFQQFNRVSNFKDRLKKYKEGKESIINVIKALGRIIIQSNKLAFLPKEKGYVYFQDFIPNNDSDIRIIVIADKAFAIKRLVRKGDFRASGSGHILYNKELFSDELIQLCFTITQKLNAQCVAYDIIFDGNKNPLILEISYGFAIRGYDSCEGYWDQNLNFHKGSFIPQEWMVELLIK